MNKNKFILGCNNYSVPFCAIASENGILYDEDKLSLVGKILDKFISGYGGYSADYRDILDGLGIKEGECILVGMPVFYEKKNNVTYENIDLACSNDKMNIYDSIKSSFCGVRHLLETKDDINMISSLEWNLNPYCVGLLEINFYVSDFPRFTFKLLIDVLSGYTLLCDGNAISVYMIKRNVSFKKGTNDKTVVKKSSYGGTFNQPNKIYMQWLEYNVNNPDNLLTFDTYCEKFVNKQNILAKILSGRLKG